MCSFHGDRGLSLLGLSDSDLNWFVMFPSASEKPLPGIRSVHQYSETDKVILIGVQGMHSILILSQPVR